MSDSVAGASLLVVDDTVENLRVLVSLLGEHGYDVRPVTSGRLALQAAASDPPDLILLDINMPEMNGYEVCERFKAIANVRDIPVIFLTAMTDTADKVKAFEVGGADYITKPFQFPEVLARVRVHVELRRAQRHLIENYERLQALERLRDDLVHMVIHDIRSPLTVLHANLELLQMRAAAGLSEVGAGHLRDAMIGSLGVQRMINEVLDVSRLEEGKMPLSVESTDLSAIARDVGGTMAASDISSTIEVPANGAVEVICDAGIVKRVLENFVSNAIKHSPEGGRIQIVVAHREGRARVEVRDEGPGVPAEERDRIFEKFETIENRAARGHSAGLGLAFCKLAVLAHNGAIGVSGNGPSGSVFWFELPAT